MILREQIIKEVNTIADLQLLNQLFEYVQVIKLTENKVTPNRERVLQGAGSITDEEAEEVRKIIKAEFNQTDTTGMTA
ncbi:MAG: hypothetical protein ICV83_16885 [Cytophagales bacterium]|nr:hypothetical protein [Cytophagales bacterium]